MAPFRAHRPLKNQQELIDINQKLDGLSEVLKKRTLCPGNSDECGAFLPGFCAITGNKTKRGLPCQIESQSENEQPVTSGEREFIKSS